MPAPVSTTIWRYSVSFVAALPAAVAMRQFYVRTTAVMQRDVTIRAAMTAATRWVRGRKRGACASLAVALIAGCFHPSYDRPACGPSSECPPGLVCNAQQICEAAVMDKPLPDGQSTE